MAQHSVPIFPREQRLLTDLGERLRLARLRRRLPAETVAVRAAISRKTLYRAEQGSPAVALGVYLRVLAVLGLTEDLTLVAKDDRLGRRLQDLGLPQVKRARRRLDV